MKISIQFKSLPLVFLVIFLSTNYCYSYVPLVKKLVSNEEVLDTLTNTVTNKKVYSFFSINKNGVLGIYKEEDVFSMKGGLLRKIYTVENIPFEGCEKNHLIKSKCVRYNQAGQIVSIHISKKMSDSEKVRKDLDYMVDASGHKHRANNLHVFIQPHAYKKPSKRQIWLHNLYSKY